MREIKVGDRVIHTANQPYNNGLEMDVTEIEDGKAIFKLESVDEPIKIDLKELRFVREMDGGFAS